MRVVAYLLLFLLLGGIIDVFEGVIFFKWDILCLC